MFGISTAWNSHRHDDAYSMIEEIKKLGIEYVELNFTLSKKIVKEIEELVRQDFIKVAGLHNFCPVPDSIDIKKASPDYYSLASINEMERKKAIEGTRHTIDAACRLNAEVVIVHSGSLAIKDRTRDLAKVIEKGIDASSFIKEMQKERDEELKRGYLEALLKSIGELSSYAKAHSIKVGLENRFYFRELPSLEEFKVIFAHFRKDSNIYYWHDTGHAQVYENLRLLPHKEYLDRFSNRLLGVHLHDVKGIISDHNAPLTGNFDFSLLKPYLNKGTLKVLEPHAPATPEEIKKGYAYLRQLYGE